MKLIDLLKDYETTITGIEGGDKKGFLLYPEDVYKIEKKLATEGRSSNT